MRSDICKIQLCYNEKQFNVATSLFILKWSNTDDSISAFLDYFDANWCKIKNDWYEEYSIGDPSQSNAIEASHKYMKTFRDLKSPHPCIKFMNGKGKELVEEWQRAPFFILDGQEIVNTNMKLYNNKPVWQQKIEQMHSNKIRHGTALFKPSAHKPSIALVTSAKSYRKSNAVNFSMK